MTAKEWVIIIFLGLNTVKDIRKKEISLFLTIGFAMIGIFWRIWDESWLAGFWGVLPGLALSALSLCCRDMVGFGDGLMVLVIGLYLGTACAVASLFRALLGCAFWGLFLIFTGRGSRKTELPFVPFLLVGFWLYVLGW